MALTAGERLRRPERVLRNGNGSPQNRHLVADVQKVETRDRLCDSLSSKQVSDYGRLLAAPFPQGQKSRRRQRCLLQAVAQREPHQAVCDMPVRGGAGW